MSNWYTISDLPKRTNIDIPETTLRRYFDKFSKFIPHNNDYDIPLFDNKSIKIFKQIKELYKEKRNTEWVYSQLQKEYEEKTKSSFIPDGLFLEDEADHNKLQENDITIIKETLQEMKVIFVQNAKEAKAQSDMIKNMMNFTMEINSSIMAMRRMMEQSLKHENQIVALQQEIKDLKEELKQKNKKFWEK